MRQNYIFPSYFPMKSFYIYLLFMLGWITPVGAQVGITAVPFIQIQPSAQGMLTGGASSASTSLNPASFFNNPAHLGYMGYNQVFTVSGFYKPMEWLPRMNRDMTYSHWSAAGGINLAEWLPVPLSIGAGYLRSDLDLDKQFITNEYGYIIGDFTASEYYNMFGLGLHLDYPVWLTLGYSRKKIVSRVMPGQESPYGRADVYDAGLAIGYTHSFENLHVGITLSNVIRNVGDHIQYTPESQFDHLPRKAVWSYELSAARPYSDNLQLLRVDWTLEASDVLVKRDVYTESWETSYTHWPGNLDVVEHMLKGKSDDQVTIRRGLRLHFLETITLGKGSFKGPGFPERIHTLGTTVNVSGLLKLTEHFQDKRLLGGIYDKLAVTYSATRLIPKTSDNPLSNIWYQEITIRWAFF